ncbi:MAG: hypothetical protein J6A01_07220 [Proteobacteria bacterium]|nr:hypothetical protein [Pseudomonadota bacterium]
MSQFPLSFDTPQRRYGALSQMLSGVSLIEHKPAEAAAAFYDVPHAGLFCGKWSPDDIAGILAETGCLSHWQRQGYVNIWIEIGNGIAPNRHEFEVWTQVEEHSELLMQLVVWLDYLQIDRLGEILPQFYVEHLRLQLPQAEPVSNLWPGQDFPSSGILRRIFGILKNWACILGASLITGIPEYFHTAWLFSEFFEFIDPEMECLFRGIVRDLHVTPACLGAISHAFEAGNVLCNGQKWFWPTEMQAYALSHELEQALRVSRASYDVHFTLNEAARMQ